MTWQRVLLLIGMTTIVLLLTTTSSTYGCNEATCASIVSKCMLTQSCKCDLPECKCCKECFACLAEWYKDCCSCVGEFYKNKNYLLKKFKQYTLMNFLFTCFM